MEDFKVEFVRPSSEVLGGLGCSSPIRPVPQKASLLVPKPEPRNDEAVVGDEPISGFGCFPNKLKLGVIGGNLIIVPFED